jgi:hypothetical protein
MEYEHYLRTIHNCANNTAVKYLRNVNKILNLAVQKEIIKNNPFEKLSFKIQEVNKEFLTNDELETLLGKEFPTNRLTHIRDIFAFCCSTVRTVNKTDEATPEQKQRAGETLPEIRKTDMFEQVVSGKPDAKRIVSDLMVESLADFNKRKDKEAGADENAKKAPDNFNIRDFA